MKNKLNIKNNDYLDSINNILSPILILEKDSGQILDANTMAQNYYGYTIKQFLTMNVSDINIMDKKDLNTVFKHIDSSGVNYFRVKHKLASGEIRDVEVYSTPFNLNGKKALSAVIHDVFEIEMIKRDSDRNMAYFKSFFVNSQTPIAIVDKNNIILNINDKFKEVFQYSYNEVCGKSILDIFNLAKEQRLRDKFISTILLNKLANERVIRKRKDGVHLDLMLLGYPLVVDNEVNGAFFMYFDISEIVENENKIEKLTYSDTLTGLFNKDYFKENLKNKIEKNNRLNNNIDKLAVLFLSINEYEEIKGALGYLQGEIISKQFSKRITENMPSDIIIAKTNENQFAITISNIKDRSELEVLCKNILSKLKQSFLLNDIQFKITASIGCSIYPDDGKDYVHLMRKAEVALSISRNLKENAIVFFNPIYDKDVLETFWIKSDLPYALEKDEMFLNYQPIYNSLTNDIIGLEVLTRWNHGHRGLISPTKFIPIAEGSDLINEIGEWVLISACMQNVAWQKSGYNPIYISVNVSVKQIVEPGFTNLIIEILQKTKMDPNFLQLEITESIFSSDYEGIKKTVTEISDLGVKFALDDFGTGYSSLVQLAQLPINNLKIDRIFIDEVDKSSSKSKIVKATISLAQSLNIGIIAEGVERIEELNFLNENNTNVIQGYYYSKPLNVSKIAALLQR